MIVEAIEEMYLDMSLVDKLKIKWGFQVGLNAAAFFELWRQNGEEQAKASVPQRTYYHYRNILIDAEFLVWDRDGNLVVADDYKPFYTR
jgi:hypothetical protein